MEIILMQTIHNLGRIGDVVQVKPGYARNYLIPGGKAQRATPKALEELEKRREELAEIRVRELTDAKERAESLRGVSVTIHRLAGEEGRLFGSVSVQDVAAALTEGGHPVSAPEVRLPDEGNPLKQIGEHTVRLVMSPEAGVDVTVHVVAGESA